MIDSFSGFTVQIALIVLILVSGLPGFTSPGPQGIVQLVERRTTDSSPSLIAIVSGSLGHRLVVTLVVPTPAASPVRKHPDGQDSSRPSSARTPVTRCWYCATRARSPRCSRGNLVGAGAAGGRPRDLPGRLR